jgi:hypothetical protein
MADEEEAQLRALREERLALGGAAAASDDVYGGGGRDRSAYVAELDVGEADGMEEDDDEGAAAGGEVARRLASYTAPKALLAEVPRGEVEDAEQARGVASRFCVQVLGLHRRERRKLTPGARAQAFGGSRRITDREDDYRKRRLNRVISPARNDAMSMVRTAVCLSLVPSTQLARARTRSHAAMRSLPPCADAVITPAACALRGVAGGQDAGRVCAHVR